MVKYRIFEETDIVDGQETPSFGLAAFDGQGELLGVAPNITPTREKAERLLKKCEKEGVSPCHLNDVAEDFIISDEY